MFTTSPHWTFSTDSVATPGTAQHAASKKELIERALERETRITQRQLMLKQLWKLHGHGTGGQS